MTDVTAPNAGSELQTGPQMRVLTQFVRDLSFENPRAPESLRMEGKPEIDMGVEMNARGRADGLFEVDLRLSVKASSNDGALFQVELVYGGVFQVANVTDETLEPLLLIECPRYLFPFARQIIASCTADGGFYPPFLLEPLDFAAVYAARKAQEGGLGAAGNA
ncbi:protein-export chaperone SecB [Caulobacter sp. 17J65-9]|uniref:protein-export chaperone SecB n=1 Tax=Caulobacter sp. 17J65-9 TaxID=2709382 RepID=UPI0013C95FC3|nr:protein-export chaperone SecB [Caulobacter sp. 17J65-9]NEX91504.1 protein-export chaperone SecB [Caulobacter sp. 17J65-9]